MKKPNRPEFKNQNPETTSAEVLSKITRYCAYQERSHREVKNKLFAYGLHAGQVDEILSHLITEGFLNEERFAKAFAGGKFRIMKWGKLKIQRELESAGVSPRNVARGLKEIDASDYSKTLHGLIKKKWSQNEDDDSFKKKNKIARFVIGKGYEPELVWEVVNNFLA